MQQTAGIGFIGGIPHGDQGRINEPQPLLEHIASGGRFGATDEAPAQLGPLQLSKETCFHQQRFIPYEALPLGRIPLLITAEIELGKAAHQRRPPWQGGPVAAE